MSACCVTEVVASLWRDRVCGESQLHQVQQGGVQKVRNWSSIVLLGPEEEITETKLMWSYCVSFTSHLTKSAPPPPHPHPAVALLWWRNISFGSSRRPCWLWPWSLPCWLLSANAGLIDSPRKKSVARLNQSRRVETRTWSACCSILAIQNLDYDKIRSFRNQD